MDPGGRLDVEGYFIGDDAAEGVQDAAGGAADVGSIFNDGDLRMLIEATEARRARYTAGNSTNYYEVLWLGHARSSQER